MITPSLKSGQKLIQQLQSYKPYKNMDEKEIRKTIGKSYGLQRARNVELEIELDELQKPIKMTQKSKNKKVKNDNVMDKSPKLVKDTLREILLRADINTIKQYCLTTKEAFKLCDDQYFWNEKLVLEGIPPMLFDHDLGTTFRNLNDINVTFYENLTNTNAKNKMMILYQLMVLANQDAKKILIVNDIERNRQFEPTSGIIKTDQSEYIPIKSFYVLPSKAVKKLNKLGDTDILVVELHYKKGKYQLYLYTTNKELSSQNTTHYKVSNNEAVNVLTLLLFDKYIAINPDLILVDSNDTEFYYDTDFRGDGGNIDRMVKQTIYGTLNALEKKGFKI